MSSSSSISERMDRLQSTLRNVLGAPCLSSIESLEKVHVDLVKSTTAISTAARQIVMDRLRMIRLQWHLTPSNQRTLESWYLISQLNSVILKWMEPPILAPSGMGSAPTRESIWTTEQNEWPRLLLAIIAFLADVGSQKEGKSRSPMPEAKWSIVAASSSDTAILQPELKKSDVATTESDSSSFNLVPGTSSWSSSSSSAAPSDGHLIVFVEEIKSQMDERKVDDSPRTADSMVSLEDESPTVTTADRTFYRATFTIPEESLVSVLVRALWRASANAQTEQSIRSKSQLLRLQEEAAKTAAAIKTLESTMDRLAKAEAACKPPDAIALNANTTTVASPFTGTASLVNDGDETESPDLTSTDPAFRLMDPRHVTHSLIRNPSGSRYRCDAKACGRTGFEIVRSETEPSWRCDSCNWDTCHQCALPLLRDIENRAAEKKAQKIEEQRKRIAASYFWDSALTTVTPSLEAPSAEVSQCLQFGSNGKLTSIVFALYVTSTVNLRHLTAELWSDVVEETSLTSGPSTLLSGLHATPMYNDIVRPKEGELRHVSIRLVRAIRVEAGRLYRIVCKSKATGVKIAIPSTRPMEVSGEVILIPDGSASSGSSRVRMIDVVFYPDIQVRQVPSKGPPPVPAPESPPASSLSSNTGGMVGPYLMYGTHLTPPNQPTDVARYELGQKFRCNVTGHALAIVFYRHPKSLEQNFICSIWDYATEIALVQRIVASASLPAFGWCSVPLSQPVTLTAGKDYAVSWGNSSGGFCHHAGGTDSPIPKWNTVTMGQQPLIPDPRGCYETAGKFPKRPFQRYYYVDVLFVPKATDTVPVLKSLTVASAASASSKPKSKHVSSTTPLSLESLISGEFGTLSVGTFRGVLSQLHPFRSKVSIRIHLLTAYRVDSLTDSVRVTGMVVHETVGIVEVTGIYALSDCSLKLHGHTRVRGAAPLCEYNGIIEFGAPCPKRVVSQNILKASFGSDPFGGPFASLPTGTTLTLACHEHPLILCRGETRALNCDICGTKNIQVQLAPIFRCTDRSHAAVISYDLCSACMTRMSGLEEATEAEIAGVKLLNATYGTGQRQTDVTGIVENLVTKNTPIRASNTLFGDPAPGIVKELTVHCLINGQPHKIITAEEKPLIFPVVAMVKSVNATVSKLTSLGATPAMFDWSRPESDRTPAVALDIDDDSDTESEYDATGVPLDLVLRFRGTFVAREGNMSGEMKLSRDDDWQQRATEAIEARANAKAEVNAAALQTVSSTPVASDSSSSSSSGFAFGYSSSNSAIPPTSSGEFTFGVPIPSSSMFTQPQTFGSFGVRPVSGQQGGFGLQIPAPTFFGSVPPSLTLSQPQPIFHQQQVFTFGAASAAPSTSTSVALSAASGSVALDPTISRLFVEANAAALKRSLSAAGPAASSSSTGTTAAAGVSSSSSTSQVSSSLAYRGLPPDSCAKMNLVTDMMPHTNSKLTLTSLMTAQWTGTQTTDSCTLISRYPLPPMHTLKTAADTVSKPPPSTLSGMVLPGTASLRNVTFEPMFETVKNQHGVMVSTKSIYQSLSCHPKYENSSLEEIRIADQDGTAYAPSQDTPSNMIAPNQISVASDSSSGSGVTVAYFETTIDRHDETGAVRIGFGHADMTPTALIGSDSKSIGLDSRTGEIIINNKRNSYSRPFTIGDVIGAGMDSATGRIWFTLNGVDLGTAHRMEEVTPTAATTSMMDTAAPTIPLCPLVCGTYTGVLHQGSSQYEERFILTSVTNQAQSDSSVFDVEGRVDCIGVGSALMRGRYESVTKSFNFRSYQTIEGSILCPSEYIGVVTTRTIGSLNETSLDGFWSDANNSSCSGKITLKLTQSVVSSSISTTAATVSSSSSSFSAFAALSFVGTGCGGVRGGGGEKPLFCIAPKNTERSRSIRKAPIRTVDSASSSNGQVHITTNFAGPFKFAFAESNESNNSTTIRFSSQLTPATKAIRVGGPDGCTLSTAYTILDGMGGVAVSTLPLPLRDVKGELETEAVEELKPEEKSKEKSAADVPASINPFSVPFVLPSTSVAAAPLTFGSSSAPSSSLNVFSVGGFSFPSSTPTSILSTDDAQSALPAPGSFVFGARSSNPFGNAPSSSTAPTPVASIPVFGSGSSATATSVSPIGPFSFSGESITNKVTKVTPTSPIKHGIKYFELTVISIGPVTTQAIGFTVPDPVLLPSICNSLLGSVGRSVGWNSRGILHNGMLSKTEGLLHGGFGAGGGGVVPHTNQLQVGAGFGQPQQQQGFGVVQQQPQPQQQAAPASVDTTSVSHPFGRFWNVGDVIGAGIDTRRRCIFFTHNGRLVGSPFAVHDIDSSIEYRPCVSLFGPGQEVRVKFGVSTNETNPMPFRWNFDLQSTSERVEIERAILNGRFTKSRISVPPIVVSMIAAFLTISELSSVALVDRMWRGALDHPIVWKQRTMIRDFSKPRPFLESTIPQIGHIVIQTSLYDPTRPRQFQQLMGSAKRCTALTLPMSMWGEVFGTTHSQLSAIPLQELHFTDCIGLHVQVAARITSQQRESERLAALYQEVNPRRPHILSQRQQIQLQTNALQSKIPQMQSSAGMSLNCKPILEGLQSYLFNISSTLRVLQFSNHELDHMTDAGTDDLASSLYHPFFDALTSAQLVNLTTFQWSGEVHYFEPVPTPGAPGLAAVNAPPTGPQLRQTSSQSSASSTNGSYFVKRGSSFSRFLQSIPALQRLHYRLLHTSPLPPSNHPDAPDMLGDVLRALPTFNALKELELAGPLKLSHLPLLTNIGDCSPTLRRVDLQLDQSFELPDTDGNGSVMLRPLPMNRNVSSGSTSSSRPGMITIEEIDQDGLAVFASTQAKLTALFQPITLPSSTQIVPTSTPESSSSSSLDIEPVASIPTASPPPNPLDPIGDWLSVGSLSGGTNLRADGSITFGDASSYGLTELILIGSSAAPSITAVPDSRAIVAMEFQRVPSESVSTFNGPIKHQRLCVDTRSSSTNVVWQSTCLGLSKGDMSISVWVYPTERAAPGAISIILAQGVTCSNSDGSNESFEPASFSFHLNSYGQPIFSRGAGIVGSGYSHIGEDSIPLNVWSHLTVICRKDIILHFLNGKLNGDVSEAYSPEQSDSVAYSSSSSMYIGGSGSSMNRFCGRMASCRLFNRAIQRKEIEKEGMNISGADQQSSLRSNTVQLSPKETIARAFKQNVAAVTSKMVVPELIYVSLSRLVELRSLRVSGISPDAVSILSWRHLTTLQNIESIALPHLAAQVSTSIPAELVLNSTFDGRLLQPSTILATLVSEWRHLISLELAMDASNTAATMPNWSTIGHHPTLRVLRITPSSGVSTISLIITESNFAATAAGSATPAVDISLLPFFSNSCWSSSLNDDSTVFRSLRILELHGVSITTYAMTVLFPSMTSLQSVRLINCRCASDVREVDAASLFRSAWSRLESVDLSAALLPVKAIIAGGPGAPSPPLTGTSEWPSFVLRWIPLSMPNLRILKLRDVKGITSELLDLISFQQLTRPYLDAATGPNTVTRFSDSSGLFSSLTDLVELDLSTYSTSSSVRKTFVPSLLQLLEKDLTNTVLPSLQQLTVSGMTDAMRTAFHQRFQSNSKLNQRTKISMINE